MEPGGLLSDQAFAALARRVMAGRCVLFLGAGASRSSGAPLARELADEIAREVVLMDLPGYSLGDVVDIATGSVGRPAVDRYIVARLQALQPAANLVEVATLPWRAIYSVNFDDLIEKAYEKEAPGVLRSFAAASQLEAIGPQERPLFLLHGSIRQPNDRRMGLVLTQDDFNGAVDQRRAFYHQLTDDMEGHEVVYLGFSLGDADFRQVVDELHDSVDRRQDLIPRGYAIMPNPPSVVKLFWDTKKITLVDGTLEALADAFRDLRKGQSLSAIPVGEHPALPRFLSTLSPVSPEAEDFLFAFEFPELDDGEPDGVTFLRGGPATWPTIRERFDVPRQQSDDLLVQLLVSPADEPPHPAPGSTKVVLLGGHAGAGKSTSARRAAWELATTWTRCVVWMRHPSRLQLDLVESLVATAKRRIYVFVDDGADAAFQVVDVIRRARRRGLRATFVIVERRNEWASATRDSPLEPDRVYELGRLTDDEAVQLIAQLDRVDELGNLKELDTDQRVNRLVQRADRQLLVALREATQDGRFDQIVENEFRNLPEESAKRAYLSVATLFQFGVATRAGVLSRATGIPFADFGSKVLQPARGVILEDASAPWEQPSYIARHRVIAEIVFRRAFRSSRERAEQVVTLLRHLDAGYREDRRAFARLINAKWLRENSIEERDLDTIYTAARRYRPGDPMVVQQQALAWRFRDRGRATELLREAADLSPNDESIRHSQAVLLTDAAQEARGSERSELFAQAESELRQLIKRDATNSASYVSLATLLMSKAESEKDPPTRIILLSEARRVLDTAFEKCAPSSFLLSMDAKFEADAGNVEAAVEDYSKAAETSGGSRTVWLNYARYLSKHSGPTAAAEALNRALDIRPTDPALNYELARQLERVAPMDVASVRRAYEYAVAEPVRGHLPELDFAIFLDRAGDSEAAEAHFTVLRQAQIPYQIKARARAWVEDAGEPKVFDSVVSDILFRSAYVNVAGFRSPIYIDLAAIPAPLRVPGAHLDVCLMYNCFGLRAVPPTMVPAGEEVDRAGLYPDDGATETNATDPGVT